MEFQNKQKNRKQVKTQIIKEKTVRITELECDYK